MAMTVSQLLSVSWSAMKCLIFLLTTVTAGAPQVDVDVVSPISKFVAANGLRYVTLVEASRTSIGARLLDNLVMKYVLRYILRSTKD